MFSASILDSAILHTVGWRQSVDPSVNIADSLLVSESGKYYEQAHPLLTLTALKAIAPNFSAFTYPKWDADTKYSIGSIVEYEGAFYVAQISNVDKEPHAGQNTSEWGLTTLFSLWLERKMRDSIISVLSNINTKKLVGEESKNIVEHKMLYDGAGNVKNLDNTSSGFVGFEIVPVRAQAAVLRIEKIGLQVVKKTSSNDQSVDFYIFHSSQVEPVKIVKVPLSSSASTRMNWTGDLAISLPYFDRTTDAGGSWYVGYFIDNLPDQCTPVYKDRDWSKVPCDFCDDTAVGFNMLSKYIEVYPVANSEASAEELDIAKNVYTQYNNHGINLELSVTCDLTPFFITHKRIFADVIMLQFAVDMLREMLYNPNVRINRTALLASRSDIVIALEGDVQTAKGGLTGGLTSKLNAAYEAIQIDLKGLDRVCLKCKNRGIKYRTI